MNTKEKILVAVLVVILVCFILAAGFLYWKLNNTPAIPATTENTATSPDENSSQILGDIFIPPAMSGNWTPAENTTKVQWRGDGLKIDDLKLIVDYRDDLYPDQQESPIVSYYDMGTNGSNKIISASIEPIAMGGPTILFFEQISGGYRFMERVSDYYVYTPEKKYGYVLSSKVLNADTSTFYEGVVGPVDLIYKGLHLEQRYLLLSDPFENYINGMGSFYDINKIDTVASGDLYLQQYTNINGDSNSPKFYTNKYIVKLPSGLFTEYNIVYDFFSDNSVPNITWSDGTKNQDNYHQDAHLGGCGNPGASVSVVTAEDISSSLKQTGTTSSGQPIYELIDINDPINKFFYDLSGGTYNYSTGQYDKLPMQDWYTHHPVILYKNSVNDYVIFTNDKYGLQAECGKPVIYLYPTQTTNVKVQVGADITKSEPTYNNGWQVTASPDGALTTADGAKYDSLFWEGTGHGDYPAITEGFVVAQNQLEAAIKSQLAELGLSGKESKDFLDFWLPKMPNTPYVRLTWFTTSQLNKLAPLMILPKPQTVIRVFLDFQGLQNNITTLPLQHLSAVPREGFTVVEWGGILRK